MIRVLRWIGYAIAGLVLLAVLAAVAVYLRSEWIVRRGYAATGTALPDVADSAGIAEGRRLATIYGCYGGCHGPNAEGSVFFDEPGVARIVAPNLPRAARSHSETEFERVVRRGIRANGRSVFAMPSRSFLSMADLDLARIRAFLLTLPETGGMDSRFELGPLARLGLTIGQFSPAAADIARASERPPLRAPDDSIALGRYWVRTACAECHGLEAEGDPSGSPPDLRIAQGYDRAAFIRLMRTGIALGDRELRLMIDMSRRRFVQLRDHEVDAIHAYLTSLPPRQ